MTTEEGLVRESDIAAHRVAKRVGLFLEARRALKESSDCSAEWWNAQGDTTHHLAELLRDSAHYEDVERIEEDAWARG